MMTEHSYRSWVEIDLDNFISNLREVRRLVGPSVKIMQVVKADAYGHGAIEISHAALKEGVSYLGVANADEGVQLRVGGIEAPIIILGPSTLSEIDAIIKYNLIPSVSDFFFASHLEAECARKGKHLPVHIEIDTGMGRGGTSHEESLELIKKIRNFPHITIEGIFTHLAQSEDKGSLYNEKQWQIFLSLLEKIDKMKIPIPLKHIANSGAVINFPHFYLNLVRPGLMTYGLYPSNKLKSILDLKPVMAFKTRIVLLKELPPHSPIGYGGTYITTKSTKVATIPVGYGDGLSILLSNCGEVLVKGRRAPIIGRISMDMCTINVTHIDCAIGDEVVLLGKQKNETISADEIAEKAHTINYDVLCALGKRAPRIFLKQGKSNAVEPRLRRIFIPEEEKSLTRLNNIIRGCLQARVDSYEAGDAIYYSIFEALFGKEDRQLQLRRNFKYTIKLTEFPNELINENPTLRDFFSVHIQVEYLKSLKNYLFYIGCARDEKQLAAFFEDENCEYRWLLNGDAATEKDFFIRSVRLDNYELPFIKVEDTKEGYKYWYSGEILKDQKFEEVKVSLDLETRKLKVNRDLSIYLNYPMQGLKIVFDYSQVKISGVKERIFFAGKNPSPLVRKKKGLIEVTVGHDRWVFPTSGITFLWD